LLAILLFVVETLALLGCGGGGGSSSSDGSSNGSPEIALSTAQLSFGNVVANAAGLRSADRSVQVTNSGTANLTIGQVAAADQLTGAFSIFEDNCSGVSLAPNASCKVIVRFSPTVPSATSFTDSFDIPSDDADEASLTVSVTGNGKGLNVTINKVDWINSEVRMIVSVTDGDNNPVADLDPADFGLFENDSQKLPNSVINSVAVPVSVAMDLDNSKSIEADLDVVKAAANGFIASLTKVDDEATVFKFARGVEQVLGLTKVQGNLPAFNTAINTDVFLKESEKNATQLYDAVDASVNALNSATNDRRAAVVLSDFVDFDVNNLEPISTQDLQGVIDNANDKKVLIFTIGLGAELDTEVMQEMALLTGGQYFEAQNSSDLTAIYDAISKILTNQYEITFDTSQADGTTNSLKVVVVNQNGLEGEDTETVTY
jgi:VWFA-related protein